MRFTRRLPTVSESKQQPAKCRGCLWGRHEGSKHFCSRVRCPKDEMMAKEAIPKIRSAGSSSSSQSKRTPSRQTTTVTSAYSASHRDSHQYVVDDYL